MTLETRSRVREQEIFNSRVDEIKRVLLIPEIKKIFSLLPKDPRVCDLFTGTGAGINAVYERLAKLGKPPSQIVGVDDFHLEEEILSFPMFRIYDRAGYPLSQAETIRNLR